MSVATDPDRVQPITRPVDLLKEIDLERDAIRGRGWGWDGSRLVTAADSPSLLGIARPVPADYVLRMTAVRRSGGGPLVAGVTRST